MSRRRARGKVVTLAYDALNRLVQRVVPGDTVAQESCGTCENNVPPSHTLLFPYFPTVLPGSGTSTSVMIVDDNQNHQRTVWYSADTVAMAYDGFGGLVASSRTVGNPMADEYTLDALGNVLAHEKNRNANDLGRTTDNQLIQ